MYEIVGKQRDLAHFLNQLLEIESEIFRIIIKLNKITHGYLNIIYIEDGLIKVQGWGWNK